MSVVGHALLWLSVPVGVSAFVLTHQCAAREITPKWVVCLIYALSCGAGAFSLTMDVARWLLENAR